MSGTLDLEVPPTSLNRLSFGVLSILTLTIGGFIGWSISAPLSSAAVAPGTIVVDSNRKIIQHLEGGIVRSIHVRDGDRVAADAVLIDLDDTRLRATLSTLQPLLEMNLLQRTRLLAERDGSSEFRPPPELADKPSSVTAQIMAEQQHTFETRRDALESKVASLENERDRARVSHDGLVKQVASQTRRIDLTSDELAKIEQLAQSGAIPQRRVLELNRALAELEGELARLEARSAETAKQITFSDLEIDRVRKSFAETVDTDLQVAERDRYELVQRIETINDQLKRVEIRAPVAGTIVGLNVHTVGGVISPGSPILEIVPEADPLVIEARVRPMDIDDLRIGMPAEVRFPSLAPRLLPRLEGQLIALSADSIVDREQGTAYFLARVRVNDVAFDRVGSNLRPGLPAEVMLVKRSRTLVDYLISPISDILDRALRE